MLVEVPLDPVDERVGLLADERRGEVLHDDRVRVDRGERRPVLLAPAAQQQPGGAQLVDAVHGRSVPLAQAGGNRQDAGGSADARRVTSALSQVLVAPLRQQERRAALLARLEQVPEHLQVVLRGLYLQPRPAEELAADCGVTVAELALVRADALAALGRASSPAAPVRAAVVSPYHS